MVAKPQMPTSKEEKATAYLNVLSEINARLRLIKSVKLSTLPYGIVRELCHLQLRHICELIAIGCLIVRGDYASSSDHYSPSKIFRVLEKSYEGFFPQPLDRLHRLRLRGVIEKDSARGWRLPGEHLSAEPSEELSEFETTEHARPPFDPTRWVQHVDFHLVWNPNPFASRRYG